MYNGRRKDCGLLLYCLEQDQHPTSTAVNSCEGCDKFYSVFDRVEQADTSLKPCPFCGGMAVIQTEQRKDGWHEYTAKFIVCKNCGCTTPKKVDGGYYGLYCSDTEITAIWNRRV